MGKLAIVTPWFGADLKGGAEQHAFQTATRLAARGHTVEVLTTCCRSFFDNWSANHWKVGKARENGILIRHFVVTRRDSAVFDRVNAKLLALPKQSLLPGVAPVSPRESQIFKDENINSPGLITYLQQHGRDYRAVLFLPYLYGPILQGVLVTPENAFLQPCLHDECYAYLSEVEAIFRAAKGCLFISQGEMELALKLFGPGIFSKSTVVGAGVETIPANSKPANEWGRYVLYLGRRDANKNVDCLVAAYQRFLDQNPQTNLSLILAGPGERNYADHPGVLDLGLVDEQQKNSLLVNALSLFQPSRNESYSRVMMEAWLHSRPVAVHAECLATATAVYAASGGWTCSTLDDWTNIFAYVDNASSKELAELGESGQRYANEHANWDIVLERYEEILGLVKNQPRVTSPPVPHLLRRIDQVLPNLSYGDAISNHALWIRDKLRAWGFESDIRAHYIDPRVAAEGLAFNEHLVPADVGIIYHHSIGTDLTPFVVAHPGPKCLIYHNITPAEFFIPWRPHFAKLLERGRAELPSLARAFPLSVGDSSFNTMELAQSGFQNPVVLPICVEPQKWNIPADPELMLRLQDGKRNLLFVGRIAPNKCQHQLVEAFAEYLCMDAVARLILVGWADPGDPYVEHVYATVDRLALQQTVMITDQVSDAELEVYYRTAHLFWSMSEHEGFCIPLIEAMWFDIPILAYKSSAIPETLGADAIMFTSKKNPTELAALAKILATDVTFRGTLIANQRIRRLNFTDAKVGEMLAALIKSLSKEYIDVQVV